MCFEFLGACCATCACQACKCCLPEPGKQSKMPYMLIMFFNICLAITLRYWGGELVADITIDDLGLCTNSAGEISNTCYGYEAVYRISFALFMFFATMAALASCPGCRSLDGSQWCVKILYFLLLLVGAWFIPLGFYDGYVQVARIVSSIFLLFQVMLLIVFSYDWNDAWMAQEMRKTIMGVSVLIYGACIAGLILLFEYFGGEGCTLNQTFISITLVMTLLFSVLALTETIEHGALLPSAVVTFYCYWVNFSAMQSDPGQCNTLQNSDTDNTWYLIVGLIWAGLSVTYAGWNLASDKTLFGFDAEGSSETAVQHQPLYTAPDDTSDDYSAHGVDEAADVRMEQQDREEDAKEHAMEVSAHQGQQNIKFHLVMASCSMYMAMLLTDWGSRQQADDTMDSYDLSVQAMWIKIITEWLTGLLYMWTLVAPYLLPGRDFGYGGD